VRSVLVAVVVLVVGAGPVSAEPARVLVVGAPGQAPRASLVAALRVQLHGGAEVEVGPSLPPGPIGEALAVAAAEVERRAATIAVWADVPAAGGGAATEVVLYAVTARGDRGLVEVGRVPAGAGAAIDRVLALKVAALLDDLAAAAATMPSPALLGGVAALRGDAAAGRARSPWALVVDGGGGFVAAETGGSGQGFVALGAGASWRSPGGRLATTLLAVGRTYDVAYFRSEAGRVVVDSLDAGGCAEVGVALGERGAWRRVRLRAAVELAARRLAVRGASPGGERRGAATQWTAAARGSVGVEVGGPRWPVAVGVRVGSEDQLGTRRFTVEGEPAADVGGGRTFVEVAIRWIFP
jgi:hypothetical protein